MAEKMTVAILGLGSRGLQVYAPIIEQNAEKMELTAVADLMEDKVEEAKTRYHLKAENCQFKVLICFGSANILLRPLSTIII